jgi:hypothetical protein
MDAKICPDGSSVGRVAPNCEFAPCPAESSSSSAPLSVSDGKIAFTYDGDRFGLAISNDQLPDSYIPACETGFAYCVYYNDGEYDDTNFEAAGVGITKRLDLTTESTCLQTVPDGYADLKPVTHDDTNYATSVFAPLGDAGVGHFSKEKLYRLFTMDSCYEIRTRVGQTQFANYPEGSIREFTAADEAAVTALLDEQLHAITLDDGTTVTFPQVQR